MTRSELLEDIAYVRTLAEEGRAAPLLGGAYLLGWGLLTAVAWVGHYWIATQSSPQYLGLWWMGFGVCAITMMAVLNRRLRGKPGMSSIGNRAERAVFKGVGLAFAAITIGSLLRMMVFQEWTAPNVIAPTAITLYGLALVAISRMSGQRMLEGFGGLALLISFAMHVLMHQPYTYLIGAGAILLTVALPGAILLRREPSTVV